MSECNKKCYQTRKEAKKDLKRMNKIYTYMKLRSVYYCEQCSMWHTTSMNYTKSYKKYKKPRLNQPRAEV